MYEGWGTGVEMDGGVCMKGGDRSVVRNLSRKGLNFFFIPGGGSTTVGACQGNEQNAFVDVPDFSNFAERRVETSNLNIRFFNLNIH